MSDDLVEQLYDTTWISHVHNQAQRDKAAREIRSLREQVARARLEGMEIMRAEAAAAATCGDVGARAFEQIIADDIRYIDTRARAMNYTPVGDSDGDDGA
jgi:cyanophycinase-like exopeptidase